MRHKRQLVSHDKRIAHLEERMNHLVEDINDQDDAMLLLRRMFVNARLQRREVMVNWVRKLIIAAPERYSADRGGVRPALNYIRDECRRWSVPWDMFHGDPSGETVRLARDWTVVTGDIAYG